MTTLLDSRMKPWACHSVLEQTQEVRFLLGQQDVHLVRESATSRASVSLQCRLLEEFFISCTFSQLNVVNPETHKNTEVVSQLHSCPNIVGK